MSDPNQMNTEERAASILLDRGVAWKLPAPFPLSIFKKTYRVVLKPLRLGTLFELSRLYTSMNIIPDDLEKDPHILLKNIPTACRIAAVCLLNTPLKIKLFSPLLARYLMRRITPDMLMEMMLFMVTYSGTASFLTFIRLTGQMKMTTPNLSQQEQGS